MHIFLNSLNNVVQPGLEPELFCTKNKRVANYTIGQFNILYLHLYIHKKNTYHIFFYLQKNKINKLSKIKIF